MDSNNDQGNGYDELLEWSKLLFNSIQVGVLIIDADTKAIVDLNSTAALIIGSRREEIIGKRCINYPCFKDNKCMDCMNRKCPIIELGLDIEDEEAVLTRMDNSKLSLLETVSVMICRNKKFLVKSFVNVTRLKGSDGDWSEAEKLLSDNIIEIKNGHQNHSFEELKNNKETLYKALDTMVMNNRGA